MQTIQYTNAITCFPQLQCLKTPIKHYPTKKQIKNTIQSVKTFVQQLNTTKSTKDEHLSPQDYNCNTQQSIECFAFLQM